MWMQLTHLLLFVEAIKCFRLFHTGHMQESKENPPQQYVEPNYFLYKYSSAGASEPKDSTETSPHDISDILEVIKKKYFLSDDKRGTPLTESSDAYNNLLEVNNQLVTDFIQDRYEDSIPLQVGVKENYEYMLKSYQNEKLKQDFKDYFKKINHLQQKAQQFLNLLIMSREIYAELNAKDSTFIEQLNKQLQKDVLVSDNTENKLLEEITYYEIQDMIDSLEFLASICYNRCAKVDETLEVDIKEMLEELGFIREHYEAINDKLDRYQTSLYERFIKHLKNYNLNKTNHHVLSKEDKIILTGISNKEIKSQLLQTLQSQDLYQQIMEAVNRDFREEFNGVVGPEFKDKDVELLASSTENEKIAVNVSSDKKEDYLEDLDCDENTIDVEGKPLCQIGIKIIPNIENKFIDMETKTEDPSFKDKDAVLVGDQLSKLFEELLQTEKLTESTEQGIETIAKSIALEKYGAKFKEIYNKIIKRYYYYKKLGTLIQNHILKIIDIILENKNEKFSPPIDQINDNEILCRYDFYSRIERVIEQHYMNMLKTIVQNRNTEEEPVPLENQIDLIQQNEVLDKYDFYRKFKNEIESHYFNIFFKDNKKDREIDEIIPGSLMKRKEDDELHGLTDGNSDIAEIDKPMLNRMIQENTDFQKWEENVNGSDS